MSIYSHYSIGVEEFKGGFIEGRLKGFRFSKIILPPLLDKEGGYRG